MSIVSMLIAYGVISTLGGGKEWEGTGRERKEVARCSSQGKKKGRKDRGVRREMYSVIS
jgi:hypothetical protein